MDQFFNADFLLYSKTFFIINPLLSVVVIIFTSLFIGSFLNVVVYRLPKMLYTSWDEECQIYLKLPQKKPPARKLSLVMPFSHCPHCQKTLMPWHNIPVLSFMFLRGKCAYCHTPIAWRYPAIEVFTSVISLYLVQQFGFSIQSIAALFLAWILIAASLIDFDHYLIPDELSLLLVWLGLFWSMWSVFCTSSAAIIGAISGYLIFNTVATIFTAITGKIGLGQGDVKLLAGLGAYLGWQQLLNIIFISSVIGLLVTIAVMAFKQKKHTQHIPFGPYLAIGGFISLVWGNNITQQVFCYPIW